MDPFVVAAMLEYTGPVQLATIDQQLDADNAAAFLLRDQYVIAADDNDRRIDALAEAAERTFLALLAGVAPRPGDAGRRPRPARRRASAADLDRRPGRAGAVRSARPRR